MGKAWGRAAVAVMTLAAAGCQTSASMRQVEMERVDQDLSSGNRGYLIGTPPEIADRGRPTRSITELEIQLPSRARRRRAPATRVAPSTVQPAAAPETEAEAMAAAEEDWPAFESTQGTIEFAPAEERQAAGGSTPASATDLPSSMRRYTTKKGDSLWKIAKRFYGDPYKWRRIYDANRDQLSNPNRVRPGLVLQIPGGAPDVQRAQDGQASEMAAAESDLK